MKQNVGDRRLVLVAQNVGGRTAAAPHAHVEGRVEAQREAARGFVELHRGDADVERDPVHRVDAEALRDRVEFAEARLDEFEAGRRTTPRALRRPRMADGSRSSAITRAPASSSARV